MTNLACEFEIKENGDDVPADVAKALANLTDTFDARFKAFETKSADNDKLAGRLSALETRLNRPTGIETQDESDKLETKSLASFEALLRYGVARIGAEEQKALVVANDGAAGYLAPTTYGSEILKKLVEFSPVRQYARVVTIGGKDIKYPRKLSGSVAVWTDEAAPSTASSMTFEQVTLRPYTMRTHVDISHEMLEDNSYDLKGELVADYAEAFGKAEATAFVNGTGASVTPGVPSQPTGIMAATGLTEMKTGAAATLGTDPAATIIAMFHQLPNAHAQNGVWMMNRKTLAALRSLKDGNGRFILVDPISAGAATTLLGRPIVEAIDMDDVGANKFPILFGDLQGYRIVDRTDLNIFPDPYTLAANGQTRFHARMRVGADVTHPDRFVKLKVAA